MLSHSESVDAIIALGSNLDSCAGSSLATLCAARDALAKLPNATVEKSSAVWKTAPVGIVDQPDFFNAALILRTALSPHALLQCLQEVERQFGRDRSHELRWGPRSLDLDIIFYGTRIIDEPDFSIPHPRFAQRAFVLFPLMELVPTMVDPRSGLSVESLLRSLPCHDGVVRLGQLTGRDNDESQERLT